MFISKWFLSLFLLANIGFSSVAFALKGDNKEPISIESNAGFYDEKNGVSTYTGEVVIVQGSMRIEADKVVVSLDDTQIEKIVATGRPVKYKQKPSEGKEDMHGHALTAEYYPETKILIMLQEAVVWQGENSTKSERIEYNRMSEVLRAGDNKSAKKRVKIVFQPKGSK